ncbi:MAG: alpha/beta fold hydrolase [Deltaproteobacteria bacterium]|nr:alpha/beta fold hydrolase [Deltaproteobacteria bacterium]
MPAARPRASDAVGVGRLAVDALLGLTDVVESMHGTIASVSLPFGVAPKTRTRGLTRLVYQAIRGVTGLIGGGIDLARAVAITDREPGSPRRETLIAVLNGIVGDHLAATNNPLALPMALRVSDHPPTCRVAVFVHGLCASPLHWKRNGHHHGELLASHGFTPVYASYNTGRHISTNGRELANALEELVASWPVPITQLVLIGHSLGGLTARSACEVARRSEHRWLAQLTQLVFLATPHHGAPLERAGNLAAMLLELSPYAAPIARIGSGRSAGITDLRFGNLLDEDWSTADPFHREDPRTPLPLPAHVDCFAVAATRGRRGDGLVPVASALGHHADPRFALEFAQERQLVVDDCGHLDVLDNRVADQLATWLRER